MSSASMPFSLSSSLCDSMSWLWRESRKRSCSFARDKKRGTTRGGCSRCSEAAEGHRSTTAWSPPTPVILLAIGPFLACACTDTCRRFVCQSASTGKNGSTRDNLVSVLQAMALKVGSCTPGSSSFWFGGTRDSLLYSCTFVNRAVHCGTAAGSRKSQQRSLRVGMDYACLCRIRVQIIIHIAFNAISSTGRVKNGPVTAMEQADINRLSRQRYSHPCPFARRAAVHGWELAFSLSFGGQTVLGISGYRLAWRNVGDDKHTRIA